MKPFLFITFFLGMLASCNTGTDPKETCDFPPGNREFAWRADTVAWFPSTVAGVWAFAGDDAYAYVMGLIVDGKPPHDVRVGRHWNGTKWEDNIHGTWGFDNPTQTWGDIAITPNDVTGDDHVMITVGSWGWDGITYGGVAEFDNRTKTWKSYQLQSAEGELRQVWTDGKEFFMAVGDNGMVYTKDGYQAEWVYSKAPTEFNFYRIDGVSKTEIYINSYLSLASGITHKQLWKFTGKTGKNSMTPKPRRKGLYSHLIYRLMG